ncbi:UVRD/Rep like helicase [Thalassiosira pseudonana CCMP1335]
MPFTSSSNHIFQHHSIRHYGYSYPLYSSTKSTVQGGETILSTADDVPPEQSSIITEGLNPSQMEATLRPRYSITRVIAGPGAGKTKVLTCRIAHLLLSCESEGAGHANGIHSSYLYREGILAVTFTKKAAMEMERRLTELVATSTQQLPVEQTTVGTFHSVCSKILRKNQFVQTLDGSFNILDQSDQLRILKDVLKEHHIELKSSSAGGGGRNDDIRPITVLNAISLMNTELAILSTPHNSIKKDDEDSSKKMSRKVRQIVTQIRVPFQKVKYSQNSVDFDDLILLTRELLLNHPEVREILHRRWRHILVDEFQDTSQVQLDLVRLLTTNSLFVVGDGDQSIYSWRGASPESMSDFEVAFHDQMHVKSVYLMENYRSTTNIVKAAQKVISTSDGHRGSQNKDSDASAQDTKFVVTSVNSMIESGDLTPSSTVAMIYRTNAQSRLIEEACVEQNLRYVVRGSSGTFYKRAEIQDCMCFLKIMYNGRDRSAWARAVKAPSRGIGDTSLEEFFRYCDAITDKYTEISNDGSSPPTPMDVMMSLARSNSGEEKDIGMLIPPKDFLSTRSLNRFIPFASSLYSLREKAKVQSVNEFLLSVIDDLMLKTHFDAISKTRDEYEDRLSNVMELIRAADRYKDDGPCIVGDLNGETVETALGNFLDDVALIADIAPDDAEVEGSGGRVVANLMTIHSSKGMEFDAVL